MAVRRIGKIMTKNEAIKYDMQVLNVFPNDISTRDVQWVLKNLLESSMEVSEEIAQQADSPDQNISCPSCDGNFKHSHGCPGEGK